MKAKKAAEAAPTRVPRAPRPQASAPSKRSKARRSSSTMTVRRVHRAEDDGYDNGLVPGLRSNEDARRLAEEIAFAVARLERLESDPPGLYAEVAALEDPREAAWLAFLIAVLSPLEGTDDPWAGINAARTTLASGEIPDLTDVPLGPRASPDPAAAIAAFRTWIERPDALLSETSLPADRRFDRLYERLGLAGLRRAQRYEFLVLLSRLGIGELDPRVLRFGEPKDDTTLAAKRVFAIGDSQLLARRAAELVMDTGIPLGALDLALVNWALPVGQPRITSGVEVDRLDIATVAHVLGVWQDGDGEWTLPVDPYAEADEDDAAVEAEGSLEAVEAQAEAEVEADVEADAEGDVAPEDLVEETVAEAEAEEADAVEADVEEIAAEIEHAEEREAIVADALAIDSDDPTQGRDD